MIDRVFYGATFGECFPSPEGMSRLMYGCVIDFLHVDIGTWTIPEALPAIGGNAYALFPIGNVADVCIIIGVVLVLITQGAFQRHIEGQAVPDASGKLALDPSRHRRAARRSATRRSAQSDVSDGQACSPSGSRSAVRSQSQ